MPDVLLTTYYTIQHAATGGKRRVQELLRALQPSVVLLQPAAVDLDQDGPSYRVDWGRRKRGINWGIFNLYWPGNRRVARRLAREHRPKVLLATSIWCHDVYAGLSISRVLDAQNVDALAIAERFGQNHPFTRLVRRQERRVVNEVDLLFCCSDTDAELFAREYDVPENKIRVAPNGVRMDDTPRADLEADRVRAEFADRCILFFMGKLDYAPNEEALAYMANTLLPELERRMPGRFVCVVSGGPNLPQNVRHPLLRYVGQVPDVAPWLRIADIGLAPVFSGSGTRIKVLEYLAAARPVVATAKAVEGLAVQDGRELVIAEKPTFADAVCQLAENPEGARLLGEQGRRLVQNNYTWEQTADQWRAGLAPLLTD